jgi:hypothetical protein
LNLSPRLEERPRQFPARKNLSAPKVLLLSLGSLDYPANYVNSPICDFQCPAEVPGEAVAPQMTPASTSSPQSSAFAQNLSLSARGQQRRVTLIDLSHTGPFYLPAAIALMYTYYFTFTQSRDNAFLC